MSNDHTNSRTFPTTIAFLAVFLLSVAMVLPHGAYAAELTTSSLATQSPSQTVNYTLGQEYTGAMGYNQGYCEKWFTFTLTERSHVHASLQTSSEVLKMVVYDSDGNVASAASNTISNANDLRNKFTYKHSCDLNAGQYQILIGKNNYSDAPITFIATAEPTISLGSVTIKGASGTAKGVASVSYSDIEQALGYETQFSKDASFASPRTVTSITTKASASGFAAGTLYVRTRAYSVYNDGVSIYGGWSRIKAITIPKAANTLQLTGKTASVSYKALANRSQNVDRRKVLAVNKAKGTVTFKKTDGNKRISVNKKNGNLTVQKGLKKGLYTVKLKVHAAGNSQYKPLSKVVAVKVRVK